MKSGPESDGSDVSCFWFLMLVGSDKTVSQTYVVPSCKSMVCICVFFAAHLIVVIGAHFHILLIGGIHNLGH